MPVLGLYKPYQAMGETWLASHARDGWQATPRPFLVKLWWALWIANAGLAAVSLTMAFNEADTDVATPIGDWIDLIGAFINIPLGLTLIAIIKRISAVQKYHLQEVFA